MSVSILWAFIFICEVRILRKYALLTSTKIVPVSSLQLSAVVLPPMLLQMVSEMSLVQPLDQQWPTAVTEGTAWKDPAD